MAVAKYKQNARGEFSTKVWDGTFNQDGTKHRINLTSKKSSRDLESKVNEYSQLLKSGTLKKPSDMSFYNYAKHWLETKKSVREKNTYNMYSNIIEKYFEFMSDVNVNNICNSHFQQAIASASEYPRTCQLIYLTFTQVLRMAVSDKLITSSERDLICMDISMPKYKRNEKRPLTELEKRSLKSCLDNNVFTAREQAYITLIYYCGLRRGEALALTRFNFQFSATDNHVSIRNVLIFDKNNPEIKDIPKTDNGIRDVTIPSQAIPYLQDYIASLTGANLFSCSTCSLITKSSYRKMWNSIVTKINITAGGTAAFPVVTNLTAHIFRHNYCSNLCYKVPEISIKKIAQLMGDTEKIVLGVYNHIIDEKEDVKSVVDDALVM